MGGHNTVCCMCGDVGFPDKLFRCGRCFSRFQHAYCSNYYEEGSSEAGGICDWCRSEERNAARAHSKRPHPGKELAAAGKRADQPEGERARQSGGGDAEKSDGGGRGKSSGGAAGPPAARPSGRRYKLLKDVLC